MAAQARRVKPLMRAAGPLRPFQAETEPLLRLIERLGSQKACRHVRVQKDGMSLTLGRVGD